MRCTLSKISQGAVASRTKQKCGDIAAWQRPQIYLNLNTICIVNDSGGSSGGAIHMTPSGLSMDLSPPLQPAKHQHQNRIKSVVTS